jgi:hypothetical protein
MNEEQKDLRSRNANIVAEMAFKAMHNDDPAAVIVIVIHRDAAAAVAFSGDPELAPHLQEILRTVAEAPRQHIIAKGEPGRSDRNG